ncbi:hypothetical protein ACTXKY_00400 [Corynebacterium variabile]|uniref:hypothetical protein n=1 Tax=Corynebacterium variabile TaxID=1727 RepID=UPI003FB68E62
MSPPLRMTVAVPAAVGDLPPLRDHHRPAGEEFRAFSEGVIQRRTVLRAGRLVIRAPATPVAVIIPTGGESQAQDNRAEGRTHPPGAPDIRRNLHPHTCTHGRCPPVERQLLFM